MNSWKNTTQDLGLPLARQQQLVAKYNSDTLRSYWFEFANNITAEQLQQNLNSLMHSNQALSSFVAKPEGFDVLRQQVQTPRLHFLVKDQCELVGNDGETLAQKKAKMEQQAQLEHAQSQPHLLVWCWPHQSGLTVQLVASTLLIDHYSAYLLYQTLSGEMQLEETIQYPEYIEWLTELVADEDAQIGKNYWQNLAVSQLSEAELIEKAPDLKVQSTLPNVVSSAISPQLQARLNQLATQLQCDCANIVINVWTNILSRLTNQNELKLDYYHDSRLDYEEFSQAFGLFTQPLVVPFYELNNADLVGATQGFSQLFTEIKDYQEYLVTDPNLASTRSHAGFFWHKQNSLIEMQTAMPIASNPLLLEYHFVEQGEGKFSLFYNHQYYSHEVITRALAHFEQLLAVALEQPEIKFSQLDVLLNDERAGLFVCQNDKLALLDKQGDLHIDNNKTLVTLFREQAQQYPKQIAIQDGAFTLTYQELDALSDQYAASLQAHGASTDNIIALCLSRHYELLVCILAVMKSGAAYLPLDPEQPIARLQQIINDAKPVIVVSELNTLSTENKISLHDLKQHKHLLQSVEILPHHLCYVLYTSGSTGTPKGVMVEHQQISHYSQAITQQLALPKQSQYGLISTLVADLGNTMLFPAWLTASCVHLLGKNEASDGLALAEYYKNVNHSHQSLECLKIVPSHLEALLACGENILPSQVLVLGGEPIQPSLIERLQSLAVKCRIYNHYGPTETTVGVLIGKVNLAHGQSHLCTTIGDNEIHLLDEQLNPVISGQSADLYVSGKNVTRGYLNDVSKTAQAYIYQPKTDKKLYRTGDLAFAAANGAIRILGRSDQQIKIRGFRLDLSEIQALLLQQNGVAQATLQAFGEGENKQLLAFVTMHQGYQLNDSQVRDFLAQQLPNYMVPAHIYAINEFPLNANGKIDQAQLRVLAKAQQNQVIVAAKNAIEQAILAIWQSVLQQQNICVTADFFDIGGHSLAAIKVVAKIRKEMNVDLPTDLLFKHKSILAIAAYINAQHSIATDKTERLIALNDKADALDESTKPIMVLMHSLAGHFNYHKQFIHNLANEVPLFGLTPNRELINTGNHDDHAIITDDYIEQLLELKSRPLVLVGWSLGGKQMMLMAKRMLSLGFNIKAISVIDFDPTQQLDLADNTQQLISDFHDYLAAENIPLSAEQISLCTQDLNGDYQSAMTQLLNHPLLQQQMFDDVDTSILYQRFMLRWHSKHVLYQATMPKLDLPIWLWHGYGYQSSPQIWQQYSNQALWCRYIDADHYGILNTPTLAKTLLSNLDKTHNVVDA
ncbi:D-alanine--D-alanyl carrier protein ligase [Pseudoalteromonas holothuriae]|uniref:D-alanine--D-alanyl carrier protein ligase n=1 Tax=Pseudoalteromonas holothuriae TaxID=2963714 RepID=A0ABM9GN34_9GAMM|nr:AMP-binding protein [Pseudoalteromonas sp. CIP111951]CAH9067883.1 D-alanine--D-alanyl carrier protein ligase [Pseudoalteromonas sp. CIP111951]